MNYRFLIITASLALACSGDDSAADGAGTAASGTVSATGNDTAEGNETPDDGNEDPDSGTATPDTGVDPTGDPTGEPTGDESTGGNPACPYEVVEGNPSLAFQLVADGFNRPLMAIGDPAQPDRLFVVEQGGNIKILEPGMTSAPADNFLSVTSASANSSTIGAESGTLGFAFHPDWPTDGRVYVHYNPPGGESHIQEWTVDAADGSQVDPTSGRTVLRLAQPASNHNGGMIAFGTDGWLYIGMGDGGGGGDQFNTSRNPNQLLAKMLRIGVDPDGTPDNPTACSTCPQLGPFDYTLPPDNPGVDGSQPWAPEIFAMGLRNPWRFAMDQANGDIYVADVGQGDWEEVSIVARGQDYGWNDMEGNHCFGGGGCDTSAGPNQVNGDGLTAPIHEYNANIGAFCVSITGGAVYHGCEVPAWDGIYIYGEYCNETLSAIHWDGTTTTDLGFIPSFNEPILGNGWNAWGDVFITTVEGDAYAPFGTGKIYRLAPG